MNAYITIITTRFEYNSIIYILFPLNTIITNNASNEIYRLTLNTKEFDDLVTFYFMNWFQF